MHPIPLAALALVLLAAPARAQTPAAAAALRDGRVAEAEAAARAAIAADPADAEAHYLLARALSAPGRPDREARAGEADRAASRAAALAPENVVYAVARLEVLRTDSWNFLIDLVRAQERAALARRILELDPGNAFAHEELGEAAIRDFYQYRNAVTTPGIEFAGLVTELFTSPERPEEQATGPGQGAAIGTPPNAARPLLVQGGAGRVASRDRFDLAALRAQGAAVLSSEPRARRAYDEAIGHLRAALERDRRRVGVYTHLVRLAALADAWAGVLPDLREMAVHAPDRVETWLYVGLVQHRLADYPAADAAFREALRRMEPAARAAFEDLTLILPPDEAAAFRADPDAFARRYWASRDPRFLNTVNERQTEHYARLVAADLLYRADDLGLAGWQTQRGRLFVRYGPPAADVVLEGAFGRVLEAVAGRPAGFATPGAAQDVNRFNVWEYPDGLRLVFEDPSRNGRFRLYAPPADLYGVVGSGADRMDFVRIAEAAVREQPERFTFEPPGRRVELPYRVVAFKGEAGADVLLSFGIPLAADAPPDADVPVNVRTGAFLVGPDRTLLVERRRSVFGLRQAQVVGFRRTRLWTSTEAFAAAPGAHEVSLEFETEGGGTSAVQRRALDVPDFAAPGLQLSDVLLAYAVEPAEGAAAPGRVVRGGLEIQPAPWAVFGREDPVFVYVEVYGLALAAGRTDYEVTADLRPKDLSTGVRRGIRRLLGRREAGVASTFEAQGSTADDAQDVILDASGQPPGVYTLTVTVRDRVGGREASRETDLILEGDE